MADNTQSTAQPQQPSSPIRREWLKGAIALGAAGAVLTLRSRASADASAPAGSSESRPKGHLWGMVVDVDKCTGCGVCIAACANESNVPPGDADAAERGRVIRWMTLTSFTEGEYPHVRSRAMPVPCQQCDSPPCTVVCPVSATYKNPEGLIAQIYPRCIGCRYCVNACPYTCKYFNWTEPHFPKEMVAGLNPDVSVRPRGVTEKCSFCHHRLQRAREEAKAKGRDLAPGDYMPACAEACPAKAIYFGDLNDPESDVSKLARSGRAFRLLEDVGTQPKVVYLSEG